MISFQPPKTAVHPINLAIHALTFLVGASSLHICKVVLGRQVLFPKIGESQKMGGALKWHTACIIKVRLCSNYSGNGECVIVVVGRKIK